MRLLVAVLAFSHREYAGGGGVLAEIPRINAATLTPESFVRGFVVPGRPVLLVGGISAAAAAFASEADASGGLGWLAASALADLPVRVSQSGNVNSEGADVEGGWTALGAFGNRTAAGFSGNRHVIFDDLSLRKSKSQSQSQSKIESKSGSHSGGSGDSGSFAANGRAAHIPFERSGRRSRRPPPALESADPHIADALRSLFAPPPLLGLRDDCVGSCSRFLMACRRGGVAQRHHHGETLNTLVVGEKNWTLWPPPGVSSPPSLPLPAGASDLALGTTPETTPQPGGGGTDQPGDQPYTEPEAWHWAPGLLPRGWGAPEALTQRAGDVLYLPEGWAHTTLATADAVGVATQRQWHDGSAAAARRRVLASACADGLEWLPMLALASLLGAGSSCWLHRP